MKLIDAYSRLAELHLRKSQGLPMPDEHPRTWERISASVIKDMKTHVRHLATANAIEELDALDSDLLDHAHLKDLPEKLKALGKGPTVIDNTLRNLRTLREFCIELGEDIATDVKPLERPSRNQVYRRDATGRAIKLAPKSPFGDYEKYGFHQSEWPEHLNEEYQGIHRFFTDEDAEHRNKTLMRGSSLANWQNGVSRIFGFLLLDGASVEDLSFRSIATVDVARRFKAFHRERMEGICTLTLKGDLWRLEHLARNYFLDTTEADRISNLIRGTTFVKRKDKGELVKRVHADDYYEVLDALLAEAVHYEAHLKKKKGRKYPQAQMAAHWHRAGLWAYMTLTCLRERNLAQATTWHIFKSDDAWHFQFKPGEMKGPRDFGDQIVDLWRGESSQRMVYRVLDRVAEVRHHLIEKFKCKYPDAPISDAFFLNEDGKAFSESAIRSLVNTVSIRYLGADKQISPHDVRTVIPTYLAIREGPEILPLIQRLLDHAHFSTTEKFYLQVQRIFNARLGQMQMEERRKQAQLQIKLSRLPDDLFKVVESSLGELRDVISRDSLQSMIEEAVVRALKNRSA